MDAAIDGLGRLVTTALLAETPAMEMQPKAPTAEAWLAPIPSESPGSTDEAQPDPALPEPSAPEDPATTLAKFCDGAPAMVARLSGMLAPPPPRPMPWAPKVAPAMYTPRQLAWVSKRQRAIYLRDDTFNEPPPDDMPGELY
jgi:hypothetical protein